MSTIDVESLLTEVSPDDPCGPDLEYDADMREIEQLSAGKAEQQIGDTIVPAQEPDWKDIRKRAVALLARSKDLRVTSLLARAMLRTEGFDGFADALGVIRGVTERYWEPLHPRLDPDDNNDPTMRINIIMGLCDQASVLTYVRNTPFVSSQSLGRFSLRELSFATGESSPPAGETAPSMSTIEGAFLDSSIEALQATQSAIERSMEHLREIESKLTDYVGSSNAPNLDPLRRLLYQALKVVKERVTARTNSEAEAEAEPEAVGTDEGSARSGAPAGGKALSGDIRSRDDVVRALEKIVEYYERQEPSSPVPILVKRCKRLVTASFEDIVKNLIPEAMSQLEVIKGPAESDGY